MPGEDDEQQATPVPIREPKEPDYAWLQPELQKESKDPGCVEFR